MSSSGSFSFLLFIFMIALALVGIGLLYQRDKFRDEIRRYYNNQENYDAHPYGSQ